MAATSTSSDPVVAPSPSAANEGPVLSVISKRIRALRKKLNRIHQMEESVSQGKTLNREQQEVLRSKPGVVTLIDELEKLRAPLSSALEEELSLALSNSSSSTTPLEKEEVPVQEEEEEKIENKEGVVKDLLSLMYFGSLFDVKAQGEFTSWMLTRTHERGCCLTYDYVTDDAADLLVERDLDSISTLQASMISRPVNSSLSHQNALEMCLHHAKLWLSNSDQRIHPQSNITYAGLREKLNKIIASDYFTATPQMKGPVEVAAAANFGSFQVQLHDSMPPVEMPVQIEGPADQYPDVVENATNYEEYDSGEHQTGDAEELQKDDVEAENPPEVVSAQTEQEQSRAVEEHDYRNADFKEQQYIPRRGLRGGRGGGGRRGGHPNGRGGRGSGPYQNGRSSHQHYDNSHYSRNYYNKRGGRGGGGGGNSYYNHLSASQGNHTQANMGVAS